MSAHLEPHHSEAMGEYDHEPIPGLPGDLPKGEHLLWQGSPDWRSLAIRAFHARKVAIYCLVLMAWHFYGRLYDGYSVAMALNALIVPMLLTIAVTALLAGLGWLSARTTIYTITSRRVVLRAGIAIPMSINIPFRSLAEGNLKLHRDGTGDVILKIAGNDRIAYAHLWPHVRRWRFKKPEPMLRCIPEPLQAAEILGRAISPEAPPELSIVESDAVRQQAAGTEMSRGRSIPKVGTTNGSRPRYAAAAR
jgi:hypothetical protein